MIMKIKYTKYIFNLYQISFYYLYFIIFLELYIIKYFLFFLILKKFNRI